jgi:glycosyltransferase 2 family protein
LSNLWGNLKGLVCGKIARPLFLVKFGVSLGLIVFLGWIVDWDRAITAIGEADRRFFLIVPFLLLARPVAAAFRWRLILADSQVELPFWQAYLNYLVGAFYSMLLPGVTGGDVVRVGRCVRQTGCQLGTATASAFLERTSGLFALLFVAFSATLFFPDTISLLLTVEQRSRVTVVAMVGAILTAIVILGRRVWQRWLPNEDVRGLWRFVRSALGALSILRGRTLGIVFILSILFQTMDIVVAFSLSQALGLGVPFAGFLAIIPLVYLATFLPISLGGLGVREGALTFLLAQFGVTTSDAVTISFLVYTSRIVTAGSGGVVQLVETLTSNRTVIAAQRANMAREI